MDKKYKTKFYSVVKASSTDVMEANIAKAGVNIKDFIPEGINFKDNGDLLPIIFEAFNVNYINRNGDCVSSEDAIDLYKSFVGKPLNLDHKRERVVGFNISSKLININDEELLDDEAKEFNEPYNCKIGSILWRVVAPKVSDYLDESIAKNEPQNEIFASFEVGFDDFDIVVIKGKSRKLIDAERIVTTQDKDFEDLSGKLKQYGGSGKIDKDTYIYRKIRGGLLGLGMALVENPAAFVSPIEVLNTNQTEVEQNNLQQDLQQNNVNEEIINQNSVNSNEINLKNNEKTEEKEKELKNMADDKEVKAEQNESTAKVEVKNFVIAKLEDITDENLKEIKANVIVDFINSEIKKANDTWVTERAEKETFIEAQKQENINLKSTIEALNTKVTELENKIVSAENQEKFNQRMNSFEVEFDLTDEDRGILASDIKDLNDEAFEAYAKKMKVLMKDKAKKKVKSEEMCPECGEPMEEEECGKCKKSKSSKGSTDKEVKEVLAEDKVVDNAIDNGKKEDAGVPNAAAAAPTLADRMSKAFSLGENVTLEDPRKRKNK